MASLGYNDLAHSGPAHENTYHVCDKQALTNKDIYCPLLRQNIDFDFFFFFWGGGSVFHDNDNWEWLYMSEVAVF